MENEPLRVMWRLCFICHWQCIFRISIASHSAKQHIKKILTIVKIFLYFCSPKGDCRGQTMSLREESRDSTEHHTS